MLNAEIWIAIAIVVGVPLSYVLGHIMGTALQRRRTEMTLADAIQRGVKIERRRTEMVLERRLRCTCGSNRAMYRHHDENCPYRVLAEAMMDIYDGVE